jgi:predicted dehydrogenase
MKDKYGVAIVGTGFGQKIHIPGFQQHPRAEVIAVYHRDRQKAGALAEEHGLPSASDNLAEILDRGDIDVVSISTPPFLHYEMGKMALEAGKHLLLEKPLNLNARETRELYRLAREKNLTAIVDFEFRFIPAWQFLAEHLQRGYIGTPRLIAIDWLVASRADPERPWNWYSREDAGGGALGALGSHAFDYIRWLFGPARGLSAHFSRAIPERPDPLEGNVFKPVTADDTCLITLELADAVPCQLSISSVVRAGRGHWLEAYGDKGTIVLGSDNLKDYVHGFRLWAAPAGRALSEVEIPKRLAFPEVFADGRLAPFIRVIDRLVEALDAGESLEPSLRDGVYSQLLMDTARESARRRAWMEVPDLEAFLRA